MMLMVRTVTGQRFYQYHLRPLYLIWIYRMNHLLPRFCVPKGLNGGVYPLLWLQLFITEANMQN